MPFDEIVEETHQKFKISCHPTPHGSHMIFLLVAILLFNSICDLSAISTPNIVAKRECAMLIIADLFYRFTVLQIDFTLLGLFVRPNAKMQAFNIELL
jgi:hypothetical protein